MPICNNDCAHFKYRYIKEVCPNSVHQGTKIVEFQRNVYSGIVLYIPSHK